MIDNLKNNFIIKKYFPNLPEKQFKLFNELAAIYPDFNRSVNLISRKDVANIYTNHILHSLSLTKIISLKNGSRVVDVGTGGGFPGIPLAIYFHDSHFTLIDSVNKKISSVNSIIKHLGLTNITTLNTRSENYHPSQKFDFVVGRAVCPIKKFYESTKHLIKKESHNVIPNGIIYLMGGDLDDKLSELYNKILIYDVKDFFKEEFFETKKIIYIKF